MLNLLVPSLQVPPPAYASLKLAAVPAVMKHATREGLDPVLLGYGFRIKPPQSTKSGLMRARVLALYPDGRCSYCGDLMGDDCTVDHVEPKMQGGVKLGVGNLVPACSACNNAKGSETLLFFILRRY
jgi:hypothetical protein